MSSSLSVNTFKINVKSFQNKEAEDLNMKLQPLNIFLLNLVLGLVNRLEGAVFGLMSLYISQRHLSSVTRKGSEDLQMNVVCSSNMNL